MTDINVFLAFGYGVLSFISPCCLPLYPAFLSYITGMSSEERQSEKSLRRRGMFHTLFFLLGLSLVFVSVGFGTSFIGGLFKEYQQLIRQLGAILIIFFGFVILGIWKPTFLMKEHRLTFQKRPSGFIGSFLVGTAFAAGWSPCAGPIIGFVVTVSATNPTSAIFYMLMYSLGFSVPFFILSFFMSKLKWIRKYQLRITQIGGVVMVLMGIVLFFDWMTKITIYTTDLFGGFTGF